MRFLDTQLGPRHRGVLYRRGRHTAAHPTILCGHCWRAGGNTAHAHLCSGRQDQLPADPQPVHIAIDERLRIEGADSAHLPSHSDRPIGTGGLGDGPQTVPRRRRVAPGTRLWFQLRQGRHCRWGGRRTGYRRRLGNRFSGDGGCQDGSRLVQRRVEQQGVFTQQQPVGAVQLHEEVEVGLVDRSRGLHPHRQPGIHPHRGEAQITEKIWPVDANPREGLGICQGHDDIGRTKTLGTMQFDDGIERLVERRIQPHIPQSERMNAAGIQSGQRSHSKDHAMVDIHFNFPCSA